MESRPPVLNFGSYEFPPEQPRAPVPGLKLPSGYQADERQSDLYALARQIERDRKIPFAEAVTAAQELLKAHG